MGLMSKDEGAKIKSLLEYFSLPSGLKGIIKNNDIDGLITAIAGDKKREGSSINFILLESAGNPVIRSIPLNKIENLIRENIEAGGL